MYKRFENIPGNVINVYMPTFTKILVKQGSEFFIIAEAHHMLLLVSLLSLVPKCVRNSGAHIGSRVPA